MAEVIQVSERTGRGGSAARRLRKSGAVPAVLYGHGEAVVSLAAPATQIAAAVRHGARVVELAGAVTTKAMIKELQWDTFHTAVQHIDFFRVSAGEQVEVELAVHARGEAAGLRSGGTVEILRHELKVKCPADQLPEAIEVDVSGLDVGDSIRVEELQLPAGVEALDDPHDVVVHCVGIRDEAEDEAGEAGAGEPEVIGRAAEDEDESGD